MTQPQPGLVQPLRKRRKPRAGLWQGITRRPNCLLAYVKVRGEQVAKSFPVDASLTEIQKWRSDTRDELSKQAPAKGTLAADIETFLEDPKNRKKHGTWLNVWSASEIASKPRQRITQEDVEVVLAGLKAEGYAGSSLNHLRQSLISFWCALDCRRRERGRCKDPKHAQCPAWQVSKFMESTPRQGFFEADQLARVLAVLPEHYRDVVEFAAFSGWRRSEIEDLPWAEVDEAGGVIRLSPERSKTEKGRVLPIEGPVAEVIARRSALRASCPLPLVFWRTVGGKIKGHRETPIRYVCIGDWRKAWRKACKQAGCGGALLHDFRRTVVRDLMRAHVPEKVAMSWTGHKTRSVFDRYDIVNESDLRDAASKLQARGLTRKADEDRK